MTRSHRWVILCSAVLILSGVFARRSPDVTLTRRDSKRHDATVAGKTETNVARPADRASDAIAPEVLAEAPALRGAKAPEAVNVLQDADETITFPGTRVDPKVILALHGSEPLTTKHPHMAAAIAVQERWTKQLMAHPAVVGTAVGINDDGQVAIIVMTKAPAENLPTLLENTPVVVWKTGDIFALNRVQDVGTAEEKVSERSKPGSGGSSSGTTTVSTKSRFTGAVPIGVSTSPARSITVPLGYIMAGTLGCRVTDGTNVFALSNNHVFALENTLSAGASMIQPGSLDGGVDADQFGTLAARVDINFTGGDNVVDAAITASTTARLGNSTPSSLNYYGTPSKTTASAAAYQPVAKVGRTSGYTKASVTAVNATVTVGYDVGNATFVGQVVVWKSGFSKAGDSGSLIVEQGSNKPVGLLFAGSNTTTFANPIDAVLNSFGVTVDGN